MYKYDSMVSIFGFFIIIIALIGAATGAYLPPEGDGEQKEEELVALDFSETRGDYANENDDIEEILKASDISKDIKRIVEVSATLTWTDEPASGIRPGNYNEPDTFSLSVESPGGESDSASGDNELLSVSLTVPEGTDFDPEEEWIFTVSCGICGDHYTRTGLIQIDTDNGNDWTLTIEVKYIAPAEAPAESPTETFMKLSTLTYILISSF